MRSLHDAPPAATDHDDGWSREGWDPGREAGRRVTNSPSTARSPLARCVVCAPAGHCAVPAVEGELVGAAAEAHTGERGPYYTGTLLLRPAGARRPLRIHVGPRWGRLLQALAALWPLDRAGGAGDAGRPLVRCYHLEEDTRKGHLRSLPDSLLVVEPDHLVDVSLLENTAYCLRQWMAGRLTPAVTSEAMVRGTVVHACFQHHLMAAAAGQAADTPLDGLPAALDGQTLALALLGRSREEMAALVAPHLERLALWYNAQGQARLGDLGEEVGRGLRCETLLLCPELGLRGRIDAVVVRHAGPAVVETILEMKTGKANPNFPDPQFQVQGYQSILHVQHRASPDSQAWVIYTGALTYDIQRVDFDMTALHRVVETRNMVVLAQRWDHVPATGTARQCARAGDRAACGAAGFLLSLGDCQGLRAQPTDGGCFTDDDRRFYARYYGLLRQEALEHGRQLTALWRQEPEERVRAGSAVALDQGRSRREQRRGVAGWRWAYTLPCRNESELRVGDRVLLSDGDPVRGEVVSGTVEEAARDHLVVSTADPLAVAPALVDRYQTTEALDERAVHALLAWLTHAPPSTRARVHAALALHGGGGDDNPEAWPRFTSPPGAAVSRGRLNAAQALALERALSMQDYLLIQGPPGTGKTTLIAEIVAALVARGERVALCAWTNRAVDTMLQGVLRAGVPALRLGSPLGIDPLLREQCALPLGEGHAAPSEPAEVARLLAERPVLAATASTWAAGRYTGDAFAFDVAIIDEAAQMTVPAALGPLRMARRAILVGDDRQLPAVVTCDAVRHDLARSLFELLRPMAQRHGALVELREQYRMNEAICAFPSAAFYDGALRSHPVAAERRLPVALPPGLPAQMRRALDPARGLVLVDVRCPLDRRTAERENPREAQAVADLAGALCALGLDPAEIGVVAPFRAQVALIRRHLETAGLAAGHDGRGVTVDTVDRFQGAEREAMLLSLVGGAASLPRSGQADFLTDPRRLNVALTRARTKLVVVGDVGMMSWRPVLRDLVAHCYEREAIVRWPT